MAEEVEEEEIPICQPGGEGMLFPATYAEQYWPHWIRAVLYLMALFYLFLGVSIVADKFVQSIERITSSKRRIRQPRTGRIITVAVWNSTVSNLTLMALGSSAPEILLSIVEAVGGGFFSGELGPSTIVGSAAFNLFVIIAVCIVAIPAGESRTIKESNVFIVTAAFSLFAYIWLVFIVQVSSPDVVDIWEGVGTLLLFPVLVVVSYMADIGYFSDRTKNGEKQALAMAGRSMSSLSDSPPPPPPFMPPPPFGALDPDPVRDKLGVPIENRHGIITFSTDTFEVASGLSGQEVTVPVFRKNGVWGAISCKYRMEGRTAVHGQDYVSHDGELHFAHGVEYKEIPVEILPKRLGEHSDEFQIIVEDAQGGAQFDPNADGGKSLDKNVLTIIILNENDALLDHSSAMRCSSFVDGVLNVDMLRQGLADWKQDIIDSICEAGDEDSGEAPSTTDKVLHLISLPWKLCFAIIVPPPALAGGWLCFVQSLVVIGGTTNVIIDFAELFGCVTGIQDSITAITFVALGTSMPDLFASKKAANDDPYADASIVNVTGSNSVNVFLGIGLPWTMASAYWAMMGPSKKWLQRYPNYVADYPNGAFIVQGGSLGFSVIVFTLGAVVAIALIWFRRKKCGGELGGDTTTKYLSGLLLVSLWLFYCIMSIWQVISNTTSFSEQMGAIFFAVCVLENAMLALGIVIYMLKGRKKETRATDLEATGVDTSRSYATLGAATTIGVPIDDRLNLRPRVQSAPDTYEVKRKDARRDSELASLRHTASPSGIGPRMFGATTGGPSISFGSAAMVMLAAGRFRNRIRSRRYHPVGPDTPPGETAYPRFGDDRHWDAPVAPAAGFQTAQDYPVLRQRVPSFHSVDTAAQEAPLDQGTPSSVINAGSVRDTVTGFIANHGMDMVALSAAGLAGVQLSR